MTSYEFNVSRLLTSKVRIDAETLEEAVEQAKIEVREMNSTDFDDIEDETVELDGDPPEGEEDAYEMFGGIQYV